MSKASYALNDRVATITLDDGKVNCINASMLHELHGALDRAQQEANCVVLRGRPGVLCAGFDLKVMNASLRDAFVLTDAGAKLLLRMLAFPRPVLIASTGHAIAMGSFITLAGDYRIGLRGAFQYGLNEVAIGMTLPHFAVQLGSSVLALPYQSRAMLTAELLEPDAAVAAGFLDRAVDEADFATEVETEARRLAGLNMNAFAATKARTREPLLQAMGNAIEADVAANARLLFDQG